jgi:hypothetical protein
LGVILLNGKDDKPPETRYEGMLKASLAQGGFDSYLALMIVIIIINFRVKI